MILQQPSLKKRGEGANSIFAEGREKIRRDKNLFLLGDVG